MNDELRATALALRDLAEATGASKATLNLAGGTLTYSDAAGFHLAVAGVVTDISDWVEYTGLVPA